MSDTFELFVGDTVQLDGGPVIVEAVGAKTADVLNLDGKNNKPRSIPNFVEKRSLILERGGQPALDKFLAHHVRHGSTRLEDGDEVILRGDRWTVVGTTTNKASIALADGSVDTITRVIANTYLPKERKPDAQRAEHLKNFLANWKPKESQGEKREEPGDATAVNESEEQNMKTKKGKKGGGKAATKTKGGGSFAGSSTFIRGLVDAGDSLTEVTKKMAEKYPSMPERMVKERFENQTNLAKKKKEAAK